MFFVNLSSANSYQHLSVRLPEDGGRSREYNYGLVNKSFRINKKKVNIGGIDFVYFEGGQGAETIVLLHGFAADKGN